MPPANLRHQGHMICTKKWYKKLRWKIVLNLDNFGLDMTGLTQSEASGTVGANSTVDKRLTLGDGCGNVKAQQMQQFTVNARRFPGVRAIQASGAIVAVGG